MHAFQVPKTVSRFFGHASKVWLLKIPYSKVASKIKWEDAGPGCFPHIYDRELGNLLNEEIVEGVVQCERTEGEEWVGVVEGVLKANA